MSTTETGSPATLSNAQVAKDLGMSTSGVSRLRSGARFPSLRVMMAIQRVYGWTVQDQTDLRVTGEGSWHERFAAVLQERAREVTE